VAALLLAIPTAFFAFRLQGAYFAIGTWVIAEVIRLLVAQWKAVGGGTGTSLPRSATRRHVAHRSRSKPCLMCATPPRATSSPTGWRYWRCRHHRRHLLAAQRPSAVWAWLRCATISKPRNPSASMQSA
jgi:hypothetical protein